MIDGPVTLLVVDDEEAIRRSMRKYLTLQGYEVAVAASGEEALTVMGRQKIAGMLLDVNLPGINGVDLVPRVLELEPDTAILMLTAVNDATSAALCMQRGALDYLLKPVDLPTSAARCRARCRGAMPDSKAATPVAASAGRSRPARRSGGSSRPTRSGSRWPRSMRW